MADGFSRKVDDILKKKLNAIDNADNRFIDGFSNIEKTIYDAVRKKVLQMNVDSGKAVFDDTNVQIINELDDIISDAIQSSNYPAKVKEYLRSFDTIKQFNFDAHQDVNDLSEKELEKLINPMQKQVVDQTIDGLTGAGISTQFTQPMKEGIFKNIVGGATITDLENYLKQFILSDELRLGQFKKYTTQIARDTLNQFDGQVNSRIAGEFGLNAYKYVGSLINDSRPQCVRWVNKGTLLLDDLPTEISWAYSNGTGMIPGTTAENFAVFRGGYNCRHSAIPFKMTKSQMEKYNRDQEQNDENESAQIDDEIESIKSEIKQGSKPNQNEQYFETNFVSSLNETDKKSFIELVSDQDDAVAISIENNTSVSVLNNRENDAVRERLKPFGFTNTKVAPLSDNSAGVCNIYNEYVSIRYNPNQSDQLLQRGYDNEFLMFEEKHKSVTEKLQKLVKNYDVKVGSIVSRGIEIDGKTISVDFKAYKTNDGELYWKPFSILDISKNVDGNVAPAISHEYAHLIHNKLDPKFKISGAVNPQKVPIDERETISLFAIKKGIRLTDAPTGYGETNWSEFYAECSTAYIHAPEWFEKYHKKAFDFFVELNESRYNFDIKTLKQYK